MINFTYDPECDTFTGVTEVGTYIASPTGHREVRQTDHPEKNTVVYVMTFQSAGVRQSISRILGEGRDAAVTAQALEHYIRNSLLEPCWGD